MDNYRYALFNEGFVSKYPKVTLALFLVTAAGYSEFSKISLSYNVCNEFKINEEYIQHPDVELESVTTKMLFKISFGIILIFLLAAETAQNGLSFYDTCGSAIRNVLHYCVYVLCGMYWAGIFLWVVKLRVGRLRPCFIEGCKISDINGTDESTLLDISACTNTKYHYYCQSFFSGHSMLAFYSFMSLAGYVYHKKIKWSNLLYVVLICIPSWIGCTRIIDNQHHPSDVLVGACVGSLFALYTFFLVNN